MIKPVGNRVYVRNIVNEEVVTASGLILKRDKGTVYTAEVLAVGTGRTLETGEVIPINLNVGDKIIYTHGATEFEFNDEVNYIVDYSDILAVL